MDVILTHLLLDCSFGVLGFGLVDLQFEVKESIDIFIS
jgi:hypothetical protein